nr:hypothetical protein [Tanacetum cinerariifolium]
MVAKRTLWEIKLPKRAITLQLSFSVLGNKGHAENQLTSDGEACLASNNRYVKMCVMDCDPGSSEVNAATSSQADVHPK